MLSKCWQVIEIMPERICNSYIRRSLDWLHEALQYVCNLQCVSTGDERRQLLWALPTNYGFYFGQSRVFWKNKSFRKIWIKLKMLGDDINRGSRSLSPSRVFIFSTSSRPALGSTQPPIQWVLRARSPEVKQPGSETDYSPPTSAEVKKM
jgi:hypothetical protein